MTISPRERASKREEVQLSFMMFANWAEDMRVRCPAQLESGSCVVQEYAAESDINAVVKRYKRTGELPPSQHRLAPVFADVSALQGKNYAEASAIAAEAARTMEVFNGQQRVREAQSHIRPVKASSDDTPTPNSDTSKA